MDQLLFLEVFPMVHQFYLLKRWQQIFLTLGLGLLQLKSQMLHKLIKT